MKKRIYPLTEIQQDIILMLKWLGIASILGAVVGIISVAFEFGLLATINFLKAETHTLIFFLFPPIGLLVSGLLTGYIAPEARGHGTDAIIDAYHMRWGEARFRVIFVKLIASIVTIGFGGSAGREGPTIQMGGGVTSNAGKSLGLNLTDQKILTLAGMSAAFGAIFLSPFAGAMFACEVAYRDDFEYKALPICIVSSIMSYLTYWMITPKRLIFVEVPKYAFDISHIPVFIVLGILCGFVGLSYVKTLYFIDEKALEWKHPEYVKTTIGGILVSITAIALGFVALLLGYEFYDGTKIFGLGWDAINLLVANPSSYILIFLFLLLIAKIFATAATIGSGGSGGVVSPSLFIGATLGAISAIILSYGNFYDFDPSVLIIVCSVALFGSIAHIPITATIMCGEMFSFQYIIPALITTAIGSWTSSIDTIYRNTLISRENRLKVAHKYRIVK